MESPPQYPGAPKKSKTGLILGLSALAIVLCCCGVCGFSGFFLKGALQKGVGMAECSTVLSQQRDGILVYASKHNGTLPAQATWQDDIKPFVKPIPDQGKAGDFVHIPTVEENVCDRSSKTAVTLNSDVAGKKLSNIKDQTGTVLLFETPGEGRNKSAKWSEPEFSTSPILLKQEHRGWLRQPIEGQGFYIDKFGSRKPAPSMNNRSSVGGVDIETKTSKGDDKD